MTRRRSWRATLDHPVTDAITVVNLFSPAAGVWRGSPYAGPDGTFDLTVRAVDLTADQDEDAWHYIIKVIYTSWPAGYIGVTPRMSRERTELARRAVENPQQPPPANPTQRPPALSFDIQEYEEGLENDAVETTGTPPKPKPVQNSANQRFVPPPTKSVAYIVAKYERNEANYDPLERLTWANTVNSTSWKGYAPKQVLCKGIIGNLEVEGVYVFFRVTYTFWIHPKDWMYRPLDAGLMSYDQVAGKLVALTEGKFGAQITTPFPLDGGGQVLVDLANPVYLAFNRYPLRDFNLLNLP